MEKTLAVSPSTFDMMENAKAAREAIALLNRVFLNWTRYGLRSGPMLDSLNQVQDVLTKLGGPWTKNP